MRVRLSAAARRDRRAAERYYARESPAASLRFRRELKSALQYILEYPHGAPVIEGTVRGKTLQVFPYSIADEVFAKLRKRFG